MAAVKQPLVWGRLQELTQNLSFLHDQFLFTSVWSGFHDLSMHVATGSHVSGRPLADLVVRLQGVGDWSQHAH